MLYALIASLAVALVSLTGILLFRDTRHIRGTHRFILPLAVGVFLGIVFFELIPETLEAAPGFGTYAVLSGFFVFYLVGHIMTTYHHQHEHHVDCDEDPLHCPAGRSARMLLFGDAVHNIADGVIIASAFLIDPAIGVVVTIGVALHEVPQEIAEFGVLIAAGYTRTRALVLNFLSATSVFIGTIAALLFASHAGDYLWLLTGFAAGNLLYIATSDLIPELRSSHKGHFYTTFMTTLTGVALIAGALFVSHGYLESQGLEHAHEAEHAAESAGTDVEPHDRDH